MFPWGPMKNCNNFAFWNLLDYWRTLLHSKKTLIIYHSLKCFSIGKCIKNRNSTTAMKHELLKKDGLKLKKGFEAQLKIEFLPPNNCTKKCLKKTLLLQQSTLMLKNFKYKQKICFLFKMNMVDRIIFSGYLIVPMFRLITYGCLAAGKKERKRERDTERNRMYQWVIYI